jgi:hypothetical protein
MKAFRTRKPSPALVISIIALFLSLGGTSYAAITLPAKSVGTKQLKNAAVTSVKIKNGAVTASKINSSGLKVASATHADSATTATTATTATNATNATTAATATTASGVVAGAITDSAFSGTGAGAVAEAGGTVTVAGTTPSFTTQFNRLGGAMTVTRSNVGFYEVNIPGLPYTDFREHIALATVIWGTGAIVATTHSIAGHLVVMTFNGAGTSTDPAGFQFVVYK